MSAVGVDDTEFARPNFVVQAGRLADKLISYILLMNALFILPDDGTEVNQSSRKQTCKLSFVIHKRCGHGPGPMTGWPSSGQAKVVAVGVMLPAVSAETDSRCTTRQLSPPMSRSAAS